MTKVIVSLMLIVSFVFGSEVDDLNLLEKNYPNLSKEELTSYYKKRDDYQLIISNYDKFDNLSLDKKLVIRNAVMDLFTASMLDKYKDVDKKVLTDFFYLYKSYINLKAYFLIDKYGYVDKYLEMGRYYALLNHSLFPDNIFYTDTYLLGEAKAGNYDLALKEYKKLLKKVSAKKDYNEIKKHYDYTLGLVKKKNIKEFIEALKNDDKKLVKNYVESNKIDLNNDRVLYNLTFLDILILGEKYDMASYIISLGADINNKDSLGKTLLHKCSSEADLKCVKFLIDNNASINTKNNYGKTPLYYAEKKGDLEVIKILKDNGAINHDKVEVFEDYNSVINLLIASSNLVKGQQVDSITRFDGAEKIKNGIELKYTVIGKNGDNSEIPKYFYRLSDNSDTSKEILKDLKTAMKGIHLSAFCKNKLFKKMDDSKIHYEIDYKLHDGTFLFNYTVYPSECLK